MKLITIITIAFAVVLLPFRHRITREAILRIVRDPATITRLAYAGIAMLWLYVADDASRIHIPPQLYTAVPFAVLLLYVVFPVRRIWLLIVITLFTGWSLQMNQTMHFQVAHLGLKTDMYGLVIITLINVFILVIGTGILYLAGPCNMKRRGRMKQDQLTRQ